MSVASTRRNDATARNAAGKRIAARLQRTILLTTQVVETIALLSIHRPTGIESTLE